MIIGTHCPSRAALQTSKLDLRDYADRISAKVGKMRVRVHDCCLTLFFYDGYDWQRTRKAIEDEMKSVRKRLERIRQLLASGQKADESIENARSVLFNSVYIGLDQSRDNLDSAALLAAIDEELDDLGQETASQSSWQTDFPSGHRISQRHTAMSASGKKARLRGKRLTRSNRPQIEMALGGIKIDVDVYDPEEPIASRLHVTVRSMEILDHIKTSTWKKFLTEMKADSKGNVRETDADMVRVELVAVRPLLPSLEEESRLRVSHDWKKLLLPRRCEVSLIATVGKVPAAQAARRSRRFGLSQALFEFFRTGFHDSPDRPTSTVISRNVQEGVA